MESGDWSDASRKHPAMAWMEEYTNALDTGDFSVPWSDWHAPEFEFHRANGVVDRGGEQAWNGVKEVYGNFASFTHTPQFLVSWETEDGWAMLGIANLYAILPGSSDGGEKVTDSKNKKWDVVVPSAFHFDYVKSDKAKHHGILLKKTRIFGDSGPVVVGLLKRGIIKPEQLMA